MKTKSYVLLIILKLVLLLSLTIIIIYFFNSTYTLNFIITYVTYKQVYDNFVGEWNYNHQINTLNKNNNNLLFNFYFYF